ncbi:unnamed protein product [Agarophyton chilense]
MNGGRGRGVITYQRNDLSLDLLTERSITTGFERVTVLMRSPRGLLSIANVYIPPQLRMTKWYTLLDDQDMIVKDCNICGSWYPSRAEAAGIEFEEHMQKTQREVLNMDCVATHTDPASRSQSSIDVAVIPEKWLPLTTWEAAPEPFTDHHACLITVDVGKKKYVQDKRKHWSLRRADWKKFSIEVENRLCMIDNREVESIDKLNEMFYVAVLEAAKHSVPFGKRRREAP